MLKVKSARPLITKKSDVKNYLQSFAANAMIDAKANFDQIFRNSSGTTSITSVKNQVLTKKFKIHTYLEFGLVVKYLTELFNECDPFQNTPELKDLWKKHYGKFNVNWTEEMVGTIVTSDEYGYSTSVDDEYRCIELSISLSEMTAVYAVIDQLRTVLTWEPSADNRDKIYLRPILSRLSQIQFTENSSWFNVKTLNHIRIVTDDILERRGFEIDTYKFHKQFVAISLLPFVISPTTDLYKE